MQRRSCSYTNTTSETPQHSETSAETNHSTAHNPLEASSVSSHPNNTGSQFQPGSPQFDANTNKAFRPASAGNPSPSRQRKVKPSQSRYDNTVEAMKPGMRRNYRPQKRVVRTTPRDLAGLRGAMETVRGQKNVSNDAVESLRRKSDHDVTDADALRTQWVLKEHEHLAASSQNVIAKLWQGYNSSHKMREARSPLESDGQASILLQQEFPECFVRQRGAARASQASPRVAQMPRFLEDLRTRRGFTLGRLTYSVALKGCVPSGALKEAELILAEMKKHGIPLEVVHYNNILLILARLEQVERFLEYYKEMRVQRRFCNAVTYSALLDCVGRTRPAEMENIWNTMVNDGCTPDAMHHTTFIRYSPNLATALHRLSLAKESGKLITPAYNAALTVAARGRHVKAGEGVFGELMQSGLEVNVASWTALMSLYTEVGDIESATGVWKRMSSSGVQPNEVTLSVLLRGCSAAVPPAVSFAEAAYEARPAPLRQSRLLTKAMVLLYASAGQVQQVDDLMRSANAHLNLFSPKNVHYYHELAMSNSRRSK